jgi:2-keto-4-pentenoate hydratase/2-oxohepta-3-ene-1,7-dioic acid hydratase in catechol pathway
MKIASFTSDAEAGYGIVSGDQIKPVTLAFREKFPTLKHVLAASALNTIVTDEAAIAISDVQLLPPVPDPGKVICVGINYVKKYPVEGQAPPLPEHIMLFGKQDGTLVGHKEPLELPSGDAANTFGYEGEIAVIIGKSGRYIPRDQALDHIAGYTIMNDGSVREWQKHSLHAGKNFARCGGCGPWMVAPDAMPSFDRMELTTR